MSNNKQNNFDITTIYERVELTQRGFPMPFYRNLLLHHEFNFFFGSQKLGKTRALLLLICKAMQKLPNKRCAILSTDNDINYMINPLLHHLKSQNKFIWINPEVIKKFKETASAIEKINTFLQRIRMFAEQCQFLECMLIDPLPRFLDWNNESMVNKLIDGLRVIAKQYKICMIGVRNEGKSKEYASTHLYKGSSAIADDSRQVIRAMACHPRSAFGKENEKNKSLIIYTELSSLNKDCGFLFKLEITEDNVAVPILIRELEHNIETIKYLCTPESGKSITSQIFKYIKNQPGGGCTLKDLYYNFKGIFKEVSIRKAVYRNFDTVKTDGDTFVQLKKQSQNIEE